MGQSSKRSSVPAVRFAEPQYRARLVGVEIPRGEAFRHFGRLLSEPRFALPMLNRTAARVIRERNTVTLRNCAL